MKIESAATLEDGGLNTELSIDQCTTFLTPEGTEALMTEAVKASTMTTIN